ncbi:hypothetical protein DF947_17775 [Pedobacter paludis]|uniref:Uncharacterized protein n=1 Tax=Pedobacter paludis TaxID=2203212 RepID=A0A317EV25_9SPHI|nr:hypothetical protein DF947_17775 [Pedobacter paludis]
MVISNELSLENLLSIEVGDIVESRIHRSGIVERVNIVKRANGTTFYFMLENEEIIIIVKQ